MNKNNISRRYYIYLPIIQYYIVKYSAVPGIIFIITVAISGKICSVVGCRKPFICSDIAFVNIQTRNRADNRFCIFVSANNSKKRNVYTVKF